MESEFPQFWTYVDPKGASSKVDITSIFNPETLKQKDNTGKIF